MHDITFISTIHKETGKCNAEELCKIINEINPEVIFLEALDDTYTEYQKRNFQFFGVYHKKLEIEAIQKYTLLKPFKFIPVLEKELSDSFEKKYNLIGENSDFQRLVDGFNLLAETNGFQFLNSAHCIKLQEEMRALESYLLDGHTFDTEAKDAIDEYEDSMLRNIYLYSKDNHFESAIYMCGAAHRKSIIEKTEKCNSQELIKLNWIVFDNEISIT